MIYLLCGYFLASCGVYVVLPRGGMAVLDLEDQGQRDGSSKGAQGFGKEAVEVWEVKPGGNGQGEEQR